MTRWTEAVGDNGGDRYAQRFAAAGTEGDAVRRLSGHVRPAGLVVAGFGLDGAHLPLETAPLGLTEYDTWCAEAGLELVSRFATWQRDAYLDGDGYAVSVHTLAAE